MDNCKAYPDKKIPEEIQNMKIKHTTSYDGDNGIIFEIAKELKSFEKEIRKFHGGIE